MIWVTISPWAVPYIVQSRERERLRRPAASFQKRGCQSLEPPPPPTPLTTLATHPETVFLSTLLSCFIRRLNTYPGITRYFRGCKAVSCLAYSRDGSMLAVGERGHQPSATVWSLETGEVLREVVGGHRIGISCICFTPSVARCRESFHTSQGVYENVSKGYFSSQAL